MNRAHQAFLTFTISQNLLKLTSIESVMPSNHLTLSHPLLLLPSVFPSISPSNEYSGHLGVLYNEKKPTAFSCLCQRPQRKAKIGNLPSTYNMLSFTLIILFM